MVIDHVISKKKKKDIIKISPISSLSEASKLLANNKIGALPVTNEKNSIVGILSERDIIRNYNLFNNNSKVFDIMTKDTITCSLKITSEKLMQIMTENKIRHIPIVEDENLLGIVSIGDVVNRLIKNFNDEAKNLRDYINS